MNMPLLATIKHDYFMQILSLPHSSSIFLAEWPVLLIFHTPIVLKKYAIAEISTFIYLLEIDRDISSALV